MLMLLPSALEWGTPPSPPQFKQSHLPPAAMPAPCDDLLALVPSWKVHPGCSQEPRCTVPSRFFFCPDAWGLAYSRLWSEDLPRTCLGVRRGSGSGSGSGPVTRIVSIRSVRGEPEMCTGRKKEGKEGENNRRWDTHARIMYTAARPRSLRACRNVHVLCCPS